MKQKSLIMIAMAAALWTACRQEPLPYTDNSLPREEAQVSILLKGGATTKADVTTRNSEDVLSTVDVYIFDADKNSLSYGLLEAYKAAEQSEITGNSARVKIKSTTGMKHIFAVANAGKNGGEALASTIRKESDFLAAISEFSDNSAGKFIMVGSGKNSESSFEPVLSSGAATANNISVELKRLVARVKIENIKGAFTSPALQNTSFRVKRIYLMNAPKQAKYANGDWTDVFGAENSTLGIHTVLTGSNMPSGFKAADNVGKYYAFGVPSTSSSQADGFYNWTDPTAWHEGDTVPLSSEAEALTAKTLTENEGKIYASPNDAVGAPSGNLIALNQYFYSYPNCSIPASVDGEADFCTKLIIETEITIDSNAYTYYYPISIPYIQPNYAYTIGTVTIMRLGSKDPFHPVTTTDCEFTLSVRPWDSGDITGSYNNEDGNSDNFVI